MTTTCNQCGANALGGSRGISSTKQLCMRCISETLVRVPPTTERRKPLQTEYLAGPAGALVKNINEDGEAWNHQAKALELLHQGQNTVLATPTASGKTLVFHLNTVTTLSTYDRARALVSYSTKVLAKDPEKKGQDSAKAVGSYYYSRKSYPATLTRGLKEWFGQDSHIMRKTKVTSVATSAAGNSEMCDCSTTRTSLEE